MDRRAWHKAWLVSEGVDDVRGRAGDCVVNMSWDRS